MTITIDLTPELEAKLQALAATKGTDACGALIDLVVALPDEGVLAPDRRRAPPTETPVHRKTTVEILAGWDAEGLPSVYGRDPQDATVIARRLRKQAEDRTLLK